MKIRRNIFFLFTLALGWAMGALFGCATSEKQPDVNEKYAAQFAAADVNVPPIMTADDYERLGDMYYDKDNLHKAFIQYEKSLGLQPDNSRVHYKKGLSLLAGKMNKNAIKEFQAVLKIRPNFAGAYEGIGQAYFQMRKYEEGVTYLKKAVELDGTLWKARTFLGIIYDRDNKHKMAIEEYKVAISIKPKIGLLYNNMGFSYYEIGEYEQAISAYKNAIQNKFDNAKVQNNMGLAFSKVGKYQEALVAFKKAGDEAKAYNNLGCVFLQHREYKKAISYFKKAININPHFYAIANDNLKKAKAGDSDGTPKRNKAGMNDIGDDDVLLGNKAGRNEVGDDNDLPEE